MGETKWTEEQLKAIETRRCNLLIAAAAGSGKTAVLVERIIRIITNEEDPVDIDRLLVVTFTSAAASEMRERIASAITKALEKSPNSKNLQKQLTLLSRANITTMHSFCLDVIKNNFHIIDLDPAFRILDETEGMLLRSEVLEELFEDKYENDDKEFLDLVEAYSDSKSDDKLKDIVLDLYKFSMSGPWPQRWLRDKSEEFNINTIEELDKSSWMKVFIENLVIELQGLISMEEKALELCEETSGLEPYIDTFRDDITMLRMIYEHLGAGVEEIYNRLSSASFSKLKTVRKNNVSNENVQGRVKSIRDDVKKKINKLRDEIFSMTPDEMLHSVKASYTYMKALSSLVIEFQDRFSNAKKEKGALDFNDLEHLCLKILTSEDSGVADNFKEYFDEVLVDEYQDSNAVQEAIIDLVSRKYSNDPNVFMVGDVKQSIYRFRQAKPELFLEKYNTYSKKQGKNIKIQLYKNFRSRDEVIKGVNYIFKEIMSRVVGELEYTDEEALNLGASYSKTEDDNYVVGGKIELNILDKSTEVEEEVLIEEEDLGTINLEARIVANRIKELLSNKDGKVFKVLDKGTGEYRPVTYKDIVILLRATKNWSEVFLDELGAEGIPVYADTGSGYFESIEIRTIMSLLKVIDNPMQDIPLIALLRSPIMSFSAEDLTNIRLVDKDKYFYENIISISKEEFDCEKELIEKCNIFLERLSVWRKKSIYTPIDEFIWYLYTDTAYYGYVGAMPNGVLRQANLRILFQRAKQYEQTSFKGLFNFINFINKLRKSSGDMGSAKVLGENEDVVRIMSIHKSKGLEFPVVFVCGSGKQFNLMDLNNNILYHEELGFGPELVDLDKRVSYPTLPKEAIKQRIRLETLSEEVRILYVAFTRAKEKLIITGAVNGLEKWITKCCNAAALDKDIILPSEVLKGKSYLDWIGMAICKHKDGEILRELVGSNDIRIKDDLSTWSVKTWTKSDLVVDKKDSDVDEINEDNLLINSDCSSVDKEIERRLDFRYKFRESTLIKSNFSVSELKKKNFEQVPVIDTENLFKEDICNIKPKFLQEERGLTAAEKGTAIHFVMQKIDLSRVNTIEEIKIQLKDFVDMELLSKEEYKVINPYKVKKFFISKLGERMLSAYNRGDIVYREIPFYTEIDVHRINPDLPKEVEGDKVRLQGVIDSFFYEDNEVILLDYKTDYVEQSNEEELINKYRIQIQYYKEALEKITKTKIKECYLYSFYLEKEILVEVN
ncbi:MULTISPECIES: helicase-exonuclease AddAB subunit AddA [Clostridium]|uniref:helicase-exonuclease AddAB subunit AddA n=1 Tax=Clostridium TaxID=1485 RepID=UPI0011C95C30|nr:MULTISPECIES: helicase-exonuclease AddAB subunit AddA [Clostridium]MDB2104890.1 helicase-exonuclease AddAB subunit AddA [Clostridium paraputrificum]MDC0803775.1 helicase-exonuclease AddAB subunit AddA [Clostridium paraputrificum]MDU1825771.1 helicase-exonuclease AddAB subunit AddA [Clostridium sp.]MDU1841927.1 helicase-exonuclease AddAB subunit AddA [Clostridium sp.]MDU2691493.1 helicase-exonuclease AddAB subunit AddA [Clostridium sp.]